MNMKMNVIVCALIVWGINS